MAFFQGPPPPIATSGFLPRTTTTRGDFAADNASTSFWGSKLQSRSSSHNAVRTMPARKGYSPWRTLQQREQALQVELQYLLDIQSDGLAMGLGQALSPTSGGPSNPPNPYSSPPRASTTASQSASQYYSEPSRHRHNVVPIRQPRSRKIGLRGARAGLSRNMSLLAAIKAEEEYLVEEALERRRQATSKLGKLCTSREDIESKLMALSDVESNPMEQELVGLRRQHQDVSREVLKLEERLALLKTRQRSLEGQMDTLQNQRDAGLSGYRGALKDVDNKLATLLSRPPIQPLDLDAWEEHPDTVTQEDGDASGMERVGSLGGDEFLRLRPERRTASMAREWWQAESMALEKRREELERDRTALEQGNVVWAEAVQLVTDFESALKSHMADEHSDQGLLDQQAAGSAKMPSQQLDDAIDGLEDRLNLVEARGWNLLVCAIGAELEAFRAARRILEEMGGVPPDKGKRVVQSTSRESDRRSETVQVADDPQADQSEPEPDNEVPADLLIDSGHVSEPHSRASPTLGENKHSEHSDRPASEPAEAGDAIPLEFLAEHSK